MWGYLRQQKRTYEKTSTDRTTDSNHLQVARLHLLLKERVVMGDELDGDVTVGNETTVLISFGPGDR